MLIGPLIKGFAICLGIIASIGPQNAFVLRQGLRNNYIIILPIVCILFDIILIISGVKGINFIVDTYPSLFSVITWAGIIFLFIYGGYSFYAMRQEKGLDTAHKKKNKRPLKETLLVLTALTFLNPSVYVETIILLGSIGGKLEDKEQCYFIIGAILASTVWFFTLSIGASILAPHFKTSKPWKVIDFLVGILMWAIAFSLLINKINF